MMISQWQCNNIRKQANVQTISEYEMTIMMLALQMLMRKTG